MQRSDDAIKTADIPFYHTLSEDGVVMPAFLDQSKIKEIRGRKIDENDVFIASFPKSGKLIFYIICRKSSGLKVLSSRFRSKSWLIGRTFLVNCYLDTVFTEFSGLDAPSLRWMSSLLADYFKNIKSGQ